MTLPQAMACLAARPERAAIFLDYDGTLSPIVADPALARPLEGVGELLEVLGGRFGLVAVVSGRPAAFLHQQLGHPRGVRLVGLYGLEEVGQPAGPMLVPGAVEVWRPVLDELAARATDSAPSGVTLERKGLGFTLHFRAAPERAEWARAFAEEARRESMVHLQPGRMAIEIRAGLDVDKGTVVRTLGLGCGAACCFGDDLGDLPAFAALGELEAAGAAVVRVAVIDAESPPEVSRAADVVVEGPPGALALLWELARA